MNLTKEWTMEGERGDMSEWGGGERRVRTREYYLLHAHAGLLGIRKGVFIPWVFCGMLCVCVLWAVNLERMWPTD